MPDQFDPQKPCKTRLGMEAEVLRTDCAGRYPILGRIKRPDGWHCANWTLEGRSLDYKPTGEDLVNITPDVVLYQPLFTKIGAGACFNDRAMATNDGRQSTLCGQFIAVLKITIRDGRDVSVEVERV